MRQQVHVMLAAVFAAIVGCIPATADGQTSSPKPASNWLLRLFEAPSWTEAVAKVDSPKTAARLVRQFVRFQEDVGDEWSDGTTTWNRGFGDCEDLAATVIQLCKDAGVEVNASVVVFSASGIEAHAVAMGTWKGRMWISSNGWFEYVDSHDDACGRVAKEMGWHATPVSMVPLASVNPARHVVASTSAESDF